MLSLGRHPNSGIILQISALFRSLPRIVDILLAPSAPAWDPLAVHTAPRADISHGNPFPLACSLWRWGAAAFHPLSVNTSSSEGHCCSLPHPHSSSCFYLFRLKSLPSKTAISSSPKTWVLWCNKTTKSLKNLRLLWITATSWKLSLFK